MERLLCVKIASRGDLLLAGPAFRWLRGSRPGAHLALAVGRSCLEVARHLPWFDEVVAVDDAALLAGSWAQKGRAARALRRLMREGASGAGAPFDAVFLFHRDWRFALLARLARIPERRGFAAGGSRKFLTHAAEVEAREHHVLQYLRMAGAGSAADDRMMGGWRFLDGEQARAETRAAASGFLCEKRSVALAFGGGRNVKTRTELKSWPMEGWRDLARALVARGFQTVWMGDAEDAALLRGDEPGVHLAGKLDLAESAVVASQAALVVSNDSFLLHLAEALGVPAVGIFGPTDPAHYCPRSSRSRTLWAGEGLSCSPCHRDGWFPVCAHEHRCLRDLSADAVLRACMEVLA